MELQATLIDHNKVYNAISGLTDIEKDKAIIQGLRAASRIFVSAGRQRLEGSSKGTGKGNLKMAFRTRVRKNKTGVYTGFNNLGHHAHLVDLGTKERIRRKGKYAGRSTGIMPANHFWTDAIFSNQNAAIDKVYTGIERGVTRILMRS